MRSVATLLLLAALLSGTTAAAGEATVPGLCDAIAARDGASAYVAVLSAFPAEVAAVLEQTTVQDRVEYDGRLIRIGEIGGVRVVVTLTEIGLVNAAATTEYLLAHYPIAAVVFSGVAGSFYQIADVTVAARFEETATGGVFDANPVLLALARRAARDVDLARCTVPPNRTEMVCFRHEPRMRVGGTGQSADPFGGNAGMCDPAGGPVFGCDAPEPIPAAARPGKSDQPVAEDMETAAVARVGKAHDVPWVGLRGVSDGAGDPLGLPGFPAQFFAYYPISAHNAAVGAAALLRRLAKIADGRHADDVCDLLAARRWNRAVRRLHAR